MKLFVANRAEVARQLMFVVLGMVASTVVCVAALHDYGSHIGFNLALGLIAMGSALVWGIAFGNLVLRACTRLEVRYESVYVKKPFKAGCEYRFADVIAANVHLGRTWFQHMPTWLVFSQSGTFQAHWCQLPILSRPQAAEIMNALVDRVVAMKTTVYIDLIRD